MHKSVENKELAPICLFVYSRPDETKRTVDSLLKNSLVAESNLYIFSDGEKTAKDHDNVIDVRKYIHSIKGFASVTIYESKMNKGLANSIISGVTQVINESGKVIVLEDDLILSSNFLCFMNEALNFYENKKRVLNISGYAFDLKYPANYQYDVAFSCRFASWGWAIWKDRWEKIDWEVKDYGSFSGNILGKLKFSRGGSDLNRMLRRQMKGKIDSWAIRFDYHHYKYDLLDVFPTTSKVIYNGFSSGATHTNKKCDTYDTVLDNSERCSFLFSDNLKSEKEIAKQFYGHYSITTRLKDKLTQWKRGKK